MLAGLVFIVKDRVANVEFLGSHFRLSDWRKLSESGVVRQPYTSLFLLIYNTTDLIGNYLSIKNIGMEFRQFPVCDGSMEQKFVRSLREIVSDYYFLDRKIDLWHPVILRLLVILGISVTALFGALMASNDSGLFFYLSYFLIMANLIGGEIVMRVWRWKRDARLKVLYQCHENSTNSPISTNSL